MRLNKNHKTLIDRFLDKKADMEELAVFFKLLSEGKLDADLKAQMDLDLVEPTLHKSSFYKKNNVLLRIAAVALVVITAISLLYFQKSDTYKISHDLMVPGENQVVLVLSNGQEISLAENVNKTITEGDTEIFIKNKDNLVYGSINNSKAKKRKGTRLNTVRTALGGTIHVQLADGSHVWLNSMSSITFPLGIDTGERTVSMEGEAYYNIVPLDSVPFVVKHRIQEINVFGTKFNVNAYENEAAVITTLLEGSISVKTATGQVQLLPGEQSIIKCGTNRIEVSKINLDDNNITDWKEGYIRFYQADLHTLVRQISRWHELDVVFGSLSSNDEFTGRIRRSEKIEDVINILKKGGINIRLEGKTLYVGL